MTPQLLVRSAAQGTLTALASHGNGGHTQFQSLRLKNPKILSPRV